MPVTLEDFPVPLLGEFGELTAVKTAVKVRRCRSGLLITKAEQNFDADDVEFRRTTLTANFSVVWCGFVWIAPKIIPISYE